MTDNTAERAVLSAVLLAQTVPPVVGAMLTPADFHDARCGEIYGAAQALTARAEPIDPVTLRAALDGRLERAGGMEFIAGLIDEVPTAEHVEAHARVVRDAALRRGLAKAAEDLARAAQDPQISLTMLDEAAISLRAPRDWGCAQSFNPPDLETFSAQNPQDTRFIVRGYAARGAVTVMGGHPKAGKTTTTAKVGAAVSQGEDFVGLPTAKGPVLWLDCMEQPKGLTARVLNAAGFAPGMLHVEWGPLPDLDRVARWCREREIALVVIDSLSKAWKGVEDGNDAVQVERAMKPFLEFAREAEVALWLIHHLRKSGGSEGLDLRGSGALAANVDIIVSFRRFSPDADAKDTRRVLDGYSRYEETPDRLVIDRVDGHLVACGTPSEVRRRDERERVVAVLGAEPMTAEAVAAVVGLSLSAIRTVLKAMVDEPEERRVVSRSGSGKRGDPYLYSLKTARKEKLVLRAVNSESEESLDVEGRYGL